MISYAAVETLVKPLALTSPALPLHQYLALPHEDIPWLIEGLVPIGGICNVFGPPKARKSFLCLDMARHISGPAEIFSEWLGFKVHKHGPILYVQLDTPRNLWMDRFHKLAAAKVDFPAHDFYVADIGQTPYPFDALKHAAQWLAIEVARIQPVLVVIDTIREAHRGDEDKSDHMQQVISSLMLACSPAAVMLVSHSKKVQLLNGVAPEASLNNDNRGSGYVAGRVDCIIQLRAREGDLHGVMAWHGRAIGHGTRKILVQDNQLWGVEPDTPETRMATAILEESFPSQRARARELAVRLGLPLSHEDRLVKVLGRLVP